VAGLEMMQRVGREKMETTHKDSRHWADGAGGAGVEFSMERTQSGQREDGGRVERGVLREDPPSRILFFNYFTFF